MAGVPTALMATLQAGTKCLAFASAASQQLFNRDRQVPHALAGCVIDGICNRRCDRYRSELSQTFCADWTGFLIEVTHEQDVEFRDIRTSRHQVAGVITIDEATQGRIRFGLFHQGLADTPYNSADRLAARGLRIDHSTTVVGAYKTIQTHQTKVRVNANFGEDRGEAEGGFRSLGAGIVVSFTGQRGDIVPGEQIVVAHRLP